MWGPNHFKYDRWGPGKSIDTHIARFCRKIAFFLIWDQRAFGPKIWPQGPNYLKYERWGPGQSIATHIVRFCEKIAIFKSGVKGPLDPRFGPGVQIVSNMNAGVQASP